MKVLIIDLVKRKIKTVKMPMKQTFYAKEGFSDTGGKSVVFDNCERVVIFGTNYGELSAIETQYKKRRSYLNSKILHISDIETILEKDEMTTINADNLIY